MFKLETDWLQVLRQAVYQQFLAALGVGGGEGCIKATNIASSLQGNEIPKKNWIDMLQIYGIDK